MRKAILNRGVSVVVLPGDVALRMAPEDATLTWHTPALPLVQPPMSELNKLAETLNKAKNITLMCGSGCAGAHDEVVKLAELLQAPVVPRCAAKSISNGITPTASA